MRLKQARTALLLVMSCAVEGQIKSPTFEVASVKPAAPQTGGYRGVTMRGGPGSPDPGQIAYTNVALIAILEIAYDAQPFQIVGPAWLSTETYDINAKIAAGSTKEEFHLMLANLLTERFRVVIHRELRQVSGYELIAGKSGSKLRQSGNADAAGQEQSANGPPANGPSVPPKKDANGFPVLNKPGVAIAMNMRPKAKAPTIYFTAKAQPLARLVDLLAEELRCPVVDRTGLMGDYDYNFEFAPGTGSLPDPDDESGPNVLTAVQQQLGLKLVAKKVPLNMLIIDAADKVPTAN